MKRFNYVNSNVTMTLRELFERMENGTITSNIAVQRGDVWDVERQSFLIDTILQNGYVPPITVSRTSDGKFEVLDGKQRTTAIHKFIKGEYGLSGVSDELEDFEGLAFDNLDDEFKDMIMNFTIIVVIFDGLEESEKNEFFFRLNNGKPLSNFEQVKAKCKSISTAYNIIDECDIFDDSKVEKAVSTDKKLELVFKSWVMLNAETPCLEKKSLNPVMMSVQITDEQVVEMEDAFDRIYEAYKYLEENATGENEKMCNKVKKRIITPTHFLSILPFAKKSLEKEISVENFALWLKGFYNGSRRASHDDLYNDNASRGSAKADSIRKRNDALARSFDVKFMD